MGRTSSSRRYEAPGSSAARSCGTKTPAKSRFDRRRGPRHTASLTFRANAADLSFEKYFGIKGYVSAQFYYKYFDTFVVEQNLPNSLFDYTGFPIPAGLQSTDPTQVGTFLPPQGITQGFIQRPFNVQGGKMYGIELAATLPLGEMISVLDGFGVTGGVSYTK